MLTDAPPESETALIFVVSDAEAEGPGETLERLVSEMRRYFISDKTSENSEKWDSFRMATRTGEGVSQATITVTRIGDKIYNYDIRELYWKDLRPSLRAAPIYSRFWKGLGLLLWLRPRCKFPPRRSWRLWVWSLFGFLILAIWCGLVSVAVVLLLPPTIDGILYIDSLYYFLVGDAASPEPSSHGSTQSSDHIRQTVVTTVLGLLAWRKIADAVDVGWSNREFLRRSSLFRSKLQRRLRGLLSGFAGPQDNYDRITLVAHGFGAAVAVDALGADSRDGFDIPKLDLITLGSPIEFLTFLSPDIQHDVYDCGKAVRSWEDFYDPRDAYCSKVPMRDSWISHRKIRLPRSWLSGFLGWAHDDYFADPDVLRHIIFPSGHDELGNANSSKRPTTSNPATTDSIKVNATMQLPPDQHDASTKQPPAARASSPYRILTLDGGGSWALIEVRALIELFGESATGHEVLGKFDMVAANSGGSIVLAGLVENMTLQNILDLFRSESKRKAIFSPTKSIVDRALHLVAGLGPKYSAVAKLPALLHLMPNTGNRPLTDAAAAIMGPSRKPVHLLIIGFNYDRNAATFFRSALVEGSGWGVGTPTNLTVAGAVHASTNAPVNYFDAAAELHGCPDRFWDGGLTGHNNPALAACVEAINLHHAPSDLRVLSLGTATVRLPVASWGAPPSPYFRPRKTDPTLVDDIVKLATTILDDPPDFATYVVHTITGGSAALPVGVESRIVRMNPLISPSGVPGAWTAPDGWAPEQFKYLCDLDMDAVEPIQVEYIDRWCSQWINGAARNQPIRMNGETLAAEVGYSKFADCVRAWRTLSE